MAATPLSESPIWGWQRRFYEQRGPDAWGGGPVPYFVTSNAFIARSYARVVFAHVHDLVTAGALDLSEPLHLVELGAGHGRFSHLLLERLLRMQAAAPVPGLRLRYVMTDVAVSDLDHLDAHPALQEHFAAGVLDSAHFDCETGTELRLRHSGDRLAPGTVANPLVVFANYVFDSLRTDAFRLNEGGLEEGLVTVTTPDGDPDPDDDDALSRVTLSYEHRPVAPHRYRDRKLTRVLEAYERLPEDIAFPWPVGAFDCLAHLRAIGADRLLVLSADKGYVEPDELLGHSDPYPVAHGSLSVSVNFHAIGEWFRALGGLALHTSPRDTALCVNLFSLGTDAPGTALAFEEHVEEFGPIDFFAIQGAASRHAEDLDLSELLAVLRMAGWDPWLLLQLSDTLLAKADDATEEQAQELRRALENGWAHEFALGDGADLPFEIGRIFWRLGEHEDALRFYELSAQLHGEHHATSFNIGLVQHAMEHPEVALEHFEHALTLDPEDERSREWRDKVRRELGVG